MLPLFIASYKNELVGCLQLGADRVGISGGVHIPLLYHMDRALSSSKKIEISLAKSRLWVYYSPTTGVAHRLGEQSSIIAANRCVSTHKIAYP